MATKKKKRIRRYERDVTAKTNKTVSNALDKNKMVDIKGILPSLEDFTVTAYPLSKDVLMFAKNEDIDMEKCDYLMRTWDPDKYKHGVMCIFQNSEDPEKYPDGTMMVGVGHKRWVCLNIMDAGRGVLTFPAATRYVSSIKEVSELYNADAAADRLAVKTITEQFPALVEEGQEFALEIWNAASTYNYVIGDTKDIKAIKFLIDTYFNFGGIKFIDKIFRTIFHSSDSRKEQLKLLKEKPMMALRTLFVRHDDNPIFKEKELIKSMSKMSSKDIIDNINHKPKKDTKKRADRLEENMVDIYNSHRRKDKIVCRGSTYINDAMKDKSNLRAPSTQPSVFQ